MFQSLTYKHASKYDRSRRTLLVAGTAVILGLEISRSPASPKVLSRNEVEAFMRLSALLIPHHLDPLTGSRLMTALGADRAPMASRVTLLLELAVAHQASKAEDFFPFADGDAKKVGLSIISAWYLGVVDSAIDARVFANERALMFGPTSDVMTTPTYPTAGPNGWGPTGAPLGAMPTF